MQEGLGNYKGKNLQKFTNLLNRKEAIHCVYFSFVCSFFPGGCTPPGSAEVTLKKVVLEKGPRRKLTSCCSSQTFKEYLFAKPNLRWFQIKLQILTACWRWARRVPFETQIGWDLGSLGPCWGIIYLSLYIPQIYSFQKSVSKRELFSMRSKSALGPTYLTWGRSISLRCLNRDLCFLIKPRKAYRT